MVPPCELWFLTKSSIILFLCFSVYFINSFYLFFISYLYCVWFYHLKTPLVLAIAQEPDSSHFLASKFGVLLKTHTKFIFHTFMRYNGLHIYTKFKRNWILCIRYAQIQIQKPITMFQSKVSFTIVWPWVMKQWCAVRSVT